MSTKQLQDAQNKKAELLIILGQGLNSWYRSGMVKDPTVKAICNDITKLDALIGKLNGIAISNEAGVCQKCQQPLLNGSKFCPECGFEMQESSTANAKLCRTCNNTIAADSNWCPICGAKAVAPPKAGGGGE